MKGRVPTTASTAPTHHTHHPAAPTRRSRRPLSLHGDVSTEQNDLHGMQVTDESETAGADSSRWLSDVPEPSPRPHTGRGMVRVWQIPPRATDPSSCPSESPRARPAVSHRAGPSRTARRTMWEPGRRTGSEWASRRCDPAPKAPSAWAAAHHPQPPERSASAHARRLRRLSECAANIT